MYTPVRNSAGDKPVLPRSNCVNDPKALVHERDDPAPPAFLSYKEKTAHAYGAEYPGPDHRINLTRTVFLAPEH